MNWDSLKNTLLEIGAPILGNMIGGPAGGMVANWIVSEFGDKVDPSDPVQIEKAIKADPEALFKLKELQARHKEKIQELQLDLFKAEVQDKQSAREREMAIVKATGSRDYFMPAMAMLIIFGFFGILSALLAINLSGLDETSKAILNIMIGVLAGEFKNVMGYYFGSSKSSADKTKLGMGK